jgi:type IV secretory pathway TraG/TraD family ATPase VirD4
MSTDRSFPLKIAGAGLVSVGLGAEVLQLPLDHSTLIGSGAITLGIVTVGGSVVWWVNGRRSTAGVINRWSRRAQRSGGTATLRDHWRVTSARAIRKRAVVLKPSLAEVSWWERRRTAVDQFGAELGTAGMRRLWVSAEDNVMRIAGTRSGKTTAMAARILKAPGGCLVTSTRVDLLRTLPMRAQMGPCHIYDPAGISGRGSTIKWSPLVGCRQPAIAAARAADMIPESGSAEGERWDVQARRVLSVLMHAAALVDRPMRAVMRWLAADGPALAQVASEVDLALAKSPMVDAMRASARQYYHTVDRTRSSIVTTAMPALAWLTDGRAAAIGDCEVSESMDLGDLIDRSGTVYILGRKDGTTAPLTGALVAEIMRRSEVTAEHRGGRLDPHLTIVLDEATKVAPGPLHQWAADCGGRGIVLDVAVHSLAALEQTWGPYAARMILSTMNAILVGAGCKDPTDLAHWEKLSGMREEPVKTFDADGKLISESTRPVPVIPAAQIAALGKGEAIVYGLGPVSIIRTPNTWKWRRVRKSLRDALNLPQETTYGDDDRLYDADPEEQEQEGGEK